MSVQEMGEERKERGGLPWWGLGALVWLTGLVAVVILMRPELAVPFLKLAAHYPRNEIRLQEAPFALLCALFVLMGLALAGLMHSKGGSRLALKRVGRGRGWGTFLLMVQAVLLTASMATEILFVSVATGAQPPSVTRAEISEHLMPQAWNDAEWLKSQLPADARIAYDCPDEFNNRSFLPALCYPMVFFELPYAEGSVERDESVVDLWRTEKGLTHRVRYFSQRRLGPFEVTPLR